MSDTGDSPFVPILTYLSMAARRSCGSSIVLSRQVSILQQYPVKDLASTRSLQPSKLPDSSYSQTSVPSKFNESFRTHSSRPTWRLHSDAFQIGAAIVALVVGQGGIVHGSS